MAVTFKVVCPVCRTTLTFETDTAEFWGTIPTFDVGCVEVTRPHSPDVEEHLDVHRQDGTLVEAVRKLHEYYAEHSPGIVERLRGA